VRKAFVWVCSDYQASRFDISVAASNSITTEESESELISIFGPPPSGSFSYHSDKGAARFGFGFLREFAVAAVCLSLLGQDRKNDDSGVTKAAADKSTM
jgi:hypothetical protein